MKLNQYFTMETATFITKLGFAFALILNSGVLGRPSRICALKNTSVELQCSGDHPSTPKWYILIGSNWTEVSVDGTGEKVKISNGNPPTLSLMDLKKDDTKSYCCKNKPDECHDDNIQLVVTGLQVKVLPSTDGQTVMLMCSTTTCTLSDKPAAYIWYKNQEVLYQDWSPWYQELVSSEKADKYSCAIQGHEVFRTPEVTVESVSPTCFHVSYTEGKMCQYNQTSVKGPCSITYPTEIQVVKNTASANHVRLTCNTSCPPTTTQFYKNRVIQETLAAIPESSGDTFQCAVKGNKDLQSAEICAGDKSCLTINYVKNRICALEGSSVNISTEYSYPRGTNPKSERWSRILWNSDKEEPVKPKEIYSENDVDTEKKIHTLTIKSMKQNDSADYRFRFQGDEKSQKAGVMLIVTDLNVRFSPSAEVTDGQRVRLTCSTRCPLTTNNNFIWFLNHQLLPEPEHHNKHLVLDPVRTQHAGKYSCSVTTQRHIRSPEKTLVVNSFPWREAAAAGVAAGAAMVFITLSVFCWIRGKRKLSKNTTLHLEETNPGHVYEEITDHPTEQNDSYYSSIVFAQAGVDPLVNMVQPHQHQQERHEPYAVVSLSNRCA